MLASTREMRHLYALSTAISELIQSYMPQVASTFSQNPYSRTVYGRAVRTTAAAKFTVMWTMTTAPAHWHDFKPNHFSLLGTTG